jgi:hypothetical protein
MLDTTYPTRYQGVDSIDADFCEKNKVSSGYTDKKTNDIYTVSYCIRLDKIKVVLMIN